MARCIPHRRVRMSPKHPPYITLLVNSLLNKRGILRKCGRIDEANQLAVRINQLIADNQGNALTHLVHATPKQLWAAVKPKRPKVDNELILDPDLVNNFFAKIPTDPDYSIDNVLKFKKDINGPDFSQGPAECITMEEILRNVKNTAPGCDSLPSWLFRSCSCELAEHIAHTYNCSIQYGVVPSSWRTGTRNT